MDNTIQHILLTGGAGYLGSILTRDLIGEGYDVTVVDNLALSKTSLLDLLYEPSFNCQVLDIRYPALISPFLDNADAVIHLAAVGREQGGGVDRDEIRHINLEAAKALYEESCRRGVKRFIFASTCTNYPNSENDEPADETSALMPFSPYGVSKAAAEEFILEHRYPGTKTVILRFPEFFGVSHVTRFDVTINRYVRDAVAEGRIELRGENCMRPYLHVRDASRAVAAFAETANGNRVEGIYNIGDDSLNIQSTALADLILEVFPDVKCIFRRRQGEEHSYSVAFGKFGNCFGLSAEYSIKDGIIELRNAIDDGSIEMFDNSRTG
jgi:nucleoside-diphosphate-sugar epimerase